MPGTNGETIEVLLDNKTVGPIDIPLQTERVLDIAKPNELLELAGFEVLEALPHRQSGVIGIEVQGDWQLQWGKQSRIRTITEFPNKPSEMMLHSSWEYVGQPYHLEAKLSQRRTTITADAEHRVTVGRTRSELTSYLNYQIRGSRTAQIQITMPGWTIDEIGPAQ